MSLVELKEIDKRFGAVHALKNVSLELEAGEIHALLGENGAGKTTLMKVLYGMVIPDHGTIKINGQPVVIRRTKDSMRYNIGMVHQHFMLVENMKVYENIAVGFEDRKGIALDKNTVVSRIKKLAEELHFEIDPEAYISNLTVGEKQRIEILKAIYRESEIIILDEPTAVLTPQEVEVLFDILRNLKKRGVSIVLITHKLKEGIAVADKFSVMRDGVMVESGLPNSNLTVQDLADLMVGRNVPLNIKRKSQCISEEKAVEVKNLNLKRTGYCSLENICFSIRKGEILGVAGVEGNGQRELEEVLSGNLEPESMELKLYGQEVSGNTRKMIGLGIALIPEDRGTMGLVSSLSIRDNIILGYHRIRDFASRFGRIRHKACMDFAEDAIRNYEIKAESPKIPVSSLSGGNQQKVMVARVMSRNPKFIIIAQPTRGVDVGAINNIHNKIFDYRDKGNAVLVISADLDEVRSLSDRIIVLYNGRIVSDKSSDEYTEKELGALMLTGEYDSEKERYDGKK